VKVLIVEDEAKVRNFLKKGLDASEFAVDTAADLDEVFGNFLSVEYDAIVLDRLLDGVDSLKSIPSIKKQFPQTRIIVLSALSEVDEKIAGLTTGADDYLGKPFHIAELIARLRAVCRRDQDGVDHLINYADMTVDLDTQKVTRAGVKIDLTAKEYKLLVFLMKKPGRVHSKTEIIDNVWDLQYYPESNVVEVVINHLRGKIDKSFSPPLIHSRRGTGYWLGDKDL
jgi:DNA-binding response OmpR family regulator